MPLPWSPWAALITSHQVIRILVCLPFYQINTIEIVQYHKSKTPQLFCNWKKKYVVRLTEFVISTRKIA